MVQEQRNWPSERYVPGQPLAHFELILTTCIAVWPGSSLQYMDVISSPRYEDFEITYQHKNPWAHMGMGYTMANVKAGSDLSPYLQLENIDPKWLKAIGYKGPADEVQEKIKEKEKIDSSGHLNGV